MSGEQLLGFLGEGVPNAFDFFGALLSGDAHYFHQFAGHFSGDLILNTALSVRIGCEKSRNFIPRHAGLFQAIEKLAVAYFAAQFLNPREKLLAVGADPPDESRGSAAKDTLTHRS